MAGTQSKRTEKRAMSKDVRVPQNTLFLLIGLLVACLLTIGFMLGKKSEAGNQERELSSSASPALVSHIPMPTLAKPTLDSRVGALEDRIGTLQQSTGTQPSRQSSVKTEALPSSSPSPIDIDARRAYFKQVDAILGSSAFTSSQPFTTRLLEQAMMGDDEKLSSVLTNTSQAAEAIAAIVAPASCKEHKDLVLGQLSHAIALLKKVQTATRAGETEKLKTLPLPNNAAMAENLRLQKLDRALRPL